MPTDGNRSQRLVLFCQPPPFDRSDLSEEGFVFAVCNENAQFLCRQLLTCDVIVTTAGHAASDTAKFCTGQCFQQRPPLLVVMADDPATVPANIQPHAVIPEAATARDLAAALQKLPRPEPER